VQESSLFHAQKIPNLLAGYSPFPDLGRGAIIGLTHHHEENSFFNMRSRHIRRRHGDWAGRT
jgi:hypothetical protein